MFQLAKPISRTRIIDGLEVVSRVNYEDDAAYLIVVAWKAGGEVVETRNVWVRNAPELMKLTEPGMDSAPVISTKADHYDSLVAYLGGKPKKDGSKDAILEWLAAAGCIPAGATAK